MSRQIAILNDENVVINIVIDDIVPSNGIEYFDLNPAFIGGDLFEGIFYPPKPFPSWLRNSGEWIAPIPKPDGAWIWNEDNLIWIPKNIEGQ